MTDEATGPTLPARVPAWRRVTEGEQRWHLGLAVLVLVALQILAPRAYAFKPVWLLPCLESGLLVVVMLANPRRINTESKVVRLLGLGLTTLYVSFTNASAFGPTDAMPLSRWIKLSMMFQSSISLLTVVLVISRAVNVLGP